METEYYSTELLDLFENISIGDHIAVKRRLYHHHMIVTAINEDNTFEIVDLFPKEGSIKVISGTKVPGIIRNLQLNWQKNVYYKVVYKINRIVGSNQSHAQSARQIYRNYCIALENKQLIQNPPDITYSFTSENCDAFIVNIKTGIKKSPEFEAFVKNVLELLNAIGLRFTKKKIETKLGKRKIIEPQQEASKTLKVDDYEADQSDGEWDVINPSAQVLDPPPH
jgi:hypothetical protein